MKQYNPDQLREVLNYDSNQEKCFGLVERQPDPPCYFFENGWPRSRAASGSPPQDQRSTGSKITTTGFQPVEIAYYLDQETMHIKSKTLNMNKPQTLPVEGVPVKRSQVESFKAGIAMILKENLILRQRFSSQIRPCKAQPPSFCIRLPETGLEP